MPIIGGQNVSIDNSAYNTAIANNRRTDIDAALAAFNTGSTNDRRVQGYIQNIQQHGWGYLGDNSIAGAAAAYLQQAGFRFNATPVTPAAPVTNPAKETITETPAEPVTATDIKDTITNTDINSDDFEKLIDLYRDAYGHADSSPQPTYQVVGDASPSASSSGSSGLIMIIILLGVAGAGYYFYKKKGGTSA